MAINLDSDKFTADWSLHWQNKPFKSHHKFKSQITGWLYNSL